MNHDLFLSALAEAEAASDLPAAARAHAASCADCGRLLDGLDRLAETDDAQFGAPPADYWRDFDERLARRLPAGPRRRTAWWAARVAAGLLVVAGAAWLAQRAWHPAPRTGAAVPDILAEAADSDPDRLVALAQSMDTSWPATAGDVADAPLAGDTLDEATAEGAAADLDVGDLSAADIFLRDSADGIGDDLSDRLGADQAKELARRLRAETSS